MNRNYTLLATAATLLWVGMLGGIRVARADASVAPCVEEATAQISELGVIVNAHLTYKRIHAKAVRRPAGVRINFVPTQGMNAPLLLQRALCEAKHAGDQHPLAVEGIQLRVAEMGPHFALFIDAPTVAAAQEVLRRVYAQNPRANRPVIYSHHRYHAYSRNQKRIRNV